MLLRPFQHQGQRSSRHIALDNLQRADGDERLMLPVQGMKVRGCMILSEHLNQDTVEHANGGHAKDPSWPPSVVPSSRLFDLQATLPGSLMRDLARGHGGSPNPPFLRSPEL